MYVAARNIIFTLLRGGFIPLFLFLHFDMSYGACTDEDFINSIINTALEKNLHKSYVWKSLLQVTDGKPNIHDPNFLLSGAEFSLENEMIKTIRSFFDAPNDTLKHSTCRFPARFAWLKSELGLDGSLFPDVHCPEFEEYLRRAPAQEIHLIFVSENVSQPSSMMGHVFFKLSGYDNNSNHVEHAISFYTIIDTINIPLLITKSTITGMKGVFSLLPYREQIKRYLETEDRNVWEYELGLPEKNKRLIYYHIWELKDLKMKYLFAGYNCATVIYNILSLSSENFQRDSHRLWVTPKDVVKEAYRNKLIVNTKLVPSDKWKIRMLSEALGKDNVEHIYNMFKKKSFKRIDLSEDPGERVYQLELIKSYANYLYRDGELDKKELQKIAEEITKRNEAKGGLDNTYFIDLSQFKSPLKTFDDTQLGLGYRRDNGRNTMKLYFLPASNSLTDDNREYFNENFLKLGEVSLLITGESLRLESFQLYAMKSLLPWNRFVKGFSGEFRLGLEEHYDKELDKHAAANVSGGIGITKKISADVNTYLLVIGGIGYGKSRGYLYAYPEVGATVYEIFNMKTILSYEYVYNQLGSNAWYHDVNVTQSYFWRKKFKVTAGYEHRFHNGHSNDAYEFLFHVYF